MKVANVVIEKIGSPNSYLIDNVQRYGTFRFYENFGISNSLASLAISDEVDNTKE